ncbi:MAG: M81 family metallopeptidase [Alphaproteobacteria bacterium]|nr:M81 family metallopeptidase [Alphaproteobacteria bacterium]
MRRLAVARIWLEVNSFSPIPTGLADFEATEWLRGEEALTRFAGTPTELGALGAFLTANSDWHAAVSRCAAAAPGGPMDEGLFERFLAEVREDFTAQRWDAVYLSLHGALVTQQRPTPELDLLRMVRDIVGRTPIGVSFDMHANLGPEVASLVDVAAGYKTLPHVDMDATATKVLTLLDRTMRGEIKPVGAIARPGRILHSFNMRTTDGPMQELEAIARAATTGPILDVTPFGGFPYGDTPYTGASVMVYSDGDAAAARATAERVADDVQRLAPQFSVTRPSAAEGLRQALARGDGPIAVLESADNTYSGGIADTPGLFRALVEMKPSVDCVFAYFCDAALVERLFRAGEGAALDVKLGGQVTGDFGPPVAVSATVVKLAQGGFVNEGPMQRGVAVRVGRSAVLAVDRIRVIVTEQRVPVNDRAYLAHHGIALDGVRLLCVKAKNHFRAAFGPLMKAVIEVDTPGPAGIDLRKFPYRYARVADYLAP